MKAFTRNVYGDTDVLQLSDIKIPEVKEGEILIRIMANSVNAADWRILRGRPLFSRLTLGIVRPKQKIPGADFAGIVVKTGNKTSKFRTGDHVFGETLLGGAFAEYATIPESACSHMPSNAEFEEMAGLPLAGLTALQALTRYGKLEKGEKVLINGASGGVGHLAVQIAKGMGASVTAVCSANNEGFVRSLGANNIIAYDREDIHKHKGHYQLVVDIHGNLRHEDYQRMGERGVIVGFTSMSHFFATSIKRLFSPFPLAQFTAEANEQDLQRLSQMVEGGQIKIHIEKTYSYQQLPDAIRHVETLRTRGKVAVSWQ